MLVSDGNGRLHEVPDDTALGWYGWAETEPLQFGYTEFGEPEVFDGFGNPLGIAPLLAALIPAAASVLPGLLSTIFGPRPTPAPGLGAWPGGGLGGYGEPAYDGYGYAQVVYDGYGNPVGALPALQSILPAITQALPAITEAIPQVTRAIQQVLPHAQAVMQAIAPPAGMHPPAGPPMPPPVAMAPPMEPDGEEPLEPEGPPPQPFPPSPPPMMMARRPGRRRAVRRRGRRRF
jgi:hypothetical protein